MSKKFQRKHRLFYDSIPQRNVQKIEGDTLIFRLLRKLTLMFNVKSKGRKTGRKFCLFIGFSLSVLSVIVIGGSYNDAQAKSYQASPTKLYVGQCDGLCQSIHIKQMKDNVGIYRPANKTPPQSGVMVPNTDYTLFSLNRLMDILQGNPVKMAAHYRW
jgi:hypothetical protein